jgi:hypothetical protein
MDSLLNIYVTPALPSMVPDRANATWVPLRSPSEEFSCTPAKLAAKSDDQSDDAKKQSTKKEDVKKEDAKKEDVKKDDTKK